MASWPTTSGQAASRCSLCPSFRGCATGPWPQGMRDQAWAGTSNGSRLPGSCDQSKAAQETGRLHPYKSNAESWDLSPSSPIHFF